MLVAVQFKDFSSLGSVQAGTLAGCLWFRVIPGTSSGFPLSLSPALLCSQLRGQRSAGSVTDPCLWVLMDTTWETLLNSFLDQVIWEVFKDNWVIIIRAVLVS